MDGNIGDDSNNSNHNDDSNDNVHNSNNYCIGDDNGNDNKNEDNHIDSHFFPLSPSFRYFAHLIPFHSLLFYLILLSYLI